MKYNIRIFFLVVFASIGLFGQTVKISENKIESRDGFYPVPILFYLPTTGYAVGGAALYYNNPEPDNPNRFPDIIGGFATYSTKKQIQVGVRSNYFYGQNDYRFDMDAAFFRTPKEFWGIGGPNP